jgi:hypothetical protein
MSLSLSSFDMKDLVTRLDARSVLAVKQIGIVRSLHRRLDLMKAFLELGTESSNAMIVTVARLCVDNALLKHIDRYHYIE